jgi:hypothetical protein
MPIVNMDVLPFDRTKDIRFNNVMGYLKYGKNKWMKKPVKINTTPEKSTSEEEAG